MTADDDAMRCDVWLFRARFCKSRALAGKLVQSGAVRVDRHGRVVRLDKPSAAVRVGDQLVVRKGADMVRLVILNLPDRRGPAPEAQSSYTLQNQL